jgi:LysR family transcriptional regulator for bpeEF and oprC
MNLDLVQIFIQVVKNGSFTKAAGQLRIPKSSVSKAIAIIEKQLGVKLLIRTTRSLTLTAAGKLLYDQCAGPIELIESASKSISGSEKILAGRLRITAPEDLGSKVISPAIAELSQKHSQLQFELNYTDEVIDLVREGYDLAVRIGKLNESSLKVKNIGDVSLVMVAAPKYLKTRTKIQDLDDLKSHDCLALAILTSINVWRLKSGIQQKQISIKPKIVSNHMSSLLAAALSGAGVALVPNFLCRELISSQRLVHILPKWSSMPLPVSLLSPLPFSSSQRLRVVADCLAEEIGKVL